MAVTHEQITNALAIIREVCKEWTDCSYCPLRREGRDGCMLNSDTLPIDWILNSDEDWRAFSN